MVLLALCISFTSHFIAFLLAHKSFHCILAHSAFHSQVAFTSHKSFHSQVVVWCPTPFGLGRNGCWLSRASQLPRALLFIFLLCCPLNDCSRGQHTASSKSIACLLFFFSPALRLPIFVSSFFSFS